VPGSRLSTVDISTSGTTRAAPDQDPASGRLRVVFLLQVPAVAQQQFLDAYQQIRYQVAAVEGYLGDQLCQSTTDPGEWMIVSEWQSPEHFAAWERTPGHRQLAEPLVACTTQRRSSRYLVRHQTDGITDPSNVGGAR
jgi:heme-degrading monooxygenase HmoA